MSRYPKNDDSPRKPMFDLSSSLSLARTALACGWISDFNVIGSKKDQSVILRRKDGTEVMYVQVDSRGNCLYRIAETPKFLKQGHIVSEGVCGVSKICEILEEWGGVNFAKEVADKSPLGMLDKAVDRVYKAVAHKGNHPEYHDRKMAQLRREWPTLFDALMDLDYAYKHCQPLFREDDDVRNIND